MIPLKQDPVESALSDQFVTKEYDIAVNAKMFSTLFDTLYEDKISSPMREYMTNAYDSHRDAGITQSFDVSLPTALEPVFKVRDYGTGLSHEDVFSVFSTAGDSKKEETNEQVGYLGLGSKAAFAYTDAFNVKVWFDGEERVYIGSKNADGIPQLSLTSTRPSTEPRGLEISYAVQRGDSAKFLDAASRIQAGFVGMDIQPKFNIPVAPLYDENDLLFQSKTCRIYRNYNYGQKTFIRQGCVLYPVSDKLGFKSFTNRAVIIIDVPIGTVAVAASRETLSLDADTKTVIAKLLSDAEAEAVDFIEKKLSQAGSYIQACKIAEMYRTTFNNSRYNYNGKNTNYAVEFDIPGVETVNVAVKVGKGYDNHPWMSVSTLEKNQFLVKYDDDTTSTRLKDRWNKWHDDNGWSRGGYNSSQLYISGVTRADLDAFKKFYEFRDDQFTDISTIIPAPRPKSANGNLNAATSRRPYRYNAGVWTQDDLPSNGEYFWLPAEKKGGRLTWGTGTAGDILEDVVRLPNYSEPLGVNNRFVPKPIYLLIPSVVKKLDPPADKRLDNVVDAYVKRHKKAIIASRLVDGHSIPDELVEDLDLLTVTKNQRWRDHNNLLMLLNLSSSRPAITQAADTKAREIKQRYPMLFNASEIEKKEYIRIMDNERKRATT